MNVTCRASPLDMCNLAATGDAYIVAANLLVPDPDHAATAVRFALRAREEAFTVPRPDMDDGSTLQMRIGEREPGIYTGRGQLGQGCNDDNVNDPADTFHPAFILPAKVCTAAASAAASWARSGGAMWCMGTQ